MIIYLSNSHYEYDVHSLVKAFYAEENVTVITPETKGEKREELLSEVALSVEIVEGESARISTILKMDGTSVQSTGKQYEWTYDGTDTYKNGFKRFFYRTLSSLTGSELPWGNLTGIRPTKLAYGMLDEKKSDEEIIAFFKEAHYVSDEKARLAVDIAKREHALIAKLHLPVDTASFSEAATDRSLAAQSKAAQTPAAKPHPSGYSLYIGIPFCPTTCLYCSFTSYPIVSYAKVVEDYIDALIREMDFVAERFAGQILDSVYVGGGTPTTLSASQLDRLLTALEEHFDLSTAQEFTVEAGRADSITEEKLLVLKAHHVGRISVNPQTMKQETLDFIGRKASVKQVREAYALARRLGFDNINMDIILGLPGENEADVQRTIDEIVVLSPDSLTVHSLAIKRASRLNQWIQQNGVSMLRNTDETMRIAAEGAKRLGMKPYYLYRQKNMSGNFENTGYAREGKYGIYNIAIMEELESIVALGAGSITKRVYPDGRIERCDNVKDVKLYIEQIDEMIERKRRLFA